MSLIAELKRRNVFRVGAAYAIVAWLLVEVASLVFPGGDEPAKPRDGWTFDFVAEPLRFSRGVNPRANMVHRIAASALTSWIQHRLGWFTLRAYSRRYSTLCSISRHALSVGVEAVSLPDLLVHFTIYETAESEDAAKRRIDHEISQLREVRG